MKVLVCGGRHWTDARFLFDMLDEWHAQEKITLLIEGGSRGADAMAFSWLRTMGSQS